MLSSLFVRDFAIVHQLELSLSRGLTVLTGETGAGKSILVDALDLALGGRGTADAIRAGADTAEVLASFELDPDHDALRWLVDNDLAADHDCILRRAVHRDRASKCFINGRPATAQALRELGDLLVDVHGQHEHQSLLRREAQRQIVDDYAGLQSEAERLAALYREHRDLQARIDSLSKETGEREGRADFLRFQVEDLERVDPQPGEYEELEQEHALLANANDLREGMHVALDGLYDADENTAVQLLARCRQRLAGLTGVDSRLESITALLDEAAVQIEEAATQLRRHLDRIDSDPERLEWVQNRLGTMLDQARKHRCGPAELLGVLESLRAELNELDGSAGSLTHLQQRLAELRGNYEDLAGRVSQVRSEAAARLSHAITAEMQDLGMRGGRFEITVTRLDDAAPTRYGLDRVEFQVSANPGQSLQPLARVASGGELSRVSLAIQVVIAGVGRVPTLVFDEVDVGIGGRVAEIVGQKLRALGDNRQVLCITHLPQVAVQGHHHWRVCKTEGDRVTVSVDCLDPAERIQEVARMLGGVEITQKTLAHAQDMLVRASG